MIAVLTACTCLSLTGSKDAAAMLRCQADDFSVSYSSNLIAGAKCSRMDAVTDRSTATLALKKRSHADSAGHSVDALPASVSSTPKSDSRVPPRIVAPASASPLPRRTLAAQREVQAAIYTYVEDGVRHFLSRKPVGMRDGVSVIPLHYIEACNFCVPGDGLNVTTLSLELRSYRREIEAAARAWGVDEALVRAVIQAESAFRSDAISSAGAQGLMQLMPTTAQRFGINDPFDAAQNIRGGVQYLAWLLRHFGGSVDLALAGYNAGEAAVERYNGVPPYEETQTYVSRVKALTQRYRSGN